MNDEQIKYYINIYIYICKSRIRGNLHMCHLINATGEIFDLNINYLKTIYDMVISNMALVFLLRYMKLN